MKILIDMQGIQTPFSALRGVGTYIDGIVRGLHEISHNHEISYLFNAEFPEAYFQCLDRFSGIISNKESAVFSQGIIKDYYSASENEIQAAEAFLSGFVESMNVDVLFSPNLQEGLHDRAITAFTGSSGRFSQIATLHDMVPMYMEQDYLSDPRVRKWYSRKIADAAKCDRIVTVSEASKEDIARFIRVDPSHVTTIFNGFNAERYCPEGPEDELVSIGSFLKRSGKYILYVGGADKHKNIPRLIEAYSLLPHSLKSTYFLVLGGGDVASSNEIRKAITRHHLDDRVLLSGYVPDQLLPALIRQATLFVFPSTYEGFGLPLVEAMACGTPALGSSTSAVGEILANPSAAFNPFDPADISRLLQQALKSSEWRTELSEQGLKRASMFSWRRSAAALLRVMEEENERRLSSEKMYLLSRRVGGAITSGEEALARAAAATIAECAPEARNPKVYVDASSVALYGGHSGIQRVVRELVRYLPDALKRCGMQFQAVYAEEGSNQLKTLSSVRCDGSFIPRPDSDEPVDFAPDDTLLFLDLHPGLAIRLEHQVQRMRALGVKVYHAVYDILPVLMPEKFWPALQEEFYRWLQCSSRSDGLLCISRTVAEQTAEYLAKFGVARPDRLMLDHFPLGSDFNAPSVGATPSSRKGDAVSGGDPTFLVVGTIEPRKAHEQVLLAFEEAWEQDQDWRLIFVGKQGWKMDRLGGRIRGHPELGNRLFWHETATDEVLKDLYRQADCVICASEGEGFGLPLIEAARAQRPLIARDIPVFREVAGDGALYFPNETTPGTLKRALHDWTNARRSGVHPKSTGIRTLSWKQAAAALSAKLNSPEWTFSIDPNGALDLRNPISIDNSNIRLRGFYSNEGAFSWAGSTSSIEFETVEDFSNVQIDLECFSWRTMPFEVFINGSEVFSAVAHERTATHTFSLLDLKSGKNLIEIRSNAASSPENDKRVLGIAVKNLRMVAKLPIKIGHWISVRDLNIDWSGFSDVEFDWRWTVGEKSYIEFFSQNDIQGAIISIFCRAAGSMRASFYFNDEKIDEKSLPTEEETICLAPVNLRTGKNVLEIVFEELRPFSDLDRRELGLRVLEIQIGNEPTEEDQSRAIRSASLLRHRPVISTSGEDHCAVSSGVIGVH